VPNTWPNALQFGAKGDWDGADISATDNFNSIQAASWFATYKSSTSFDAGGFWGGRVQFPSGSFMINGNGATPLVVGSNVIFEGPNASGGSTIRISSAFASTGVNNIELGDPNWHFACFNTKLREIEVAAPPVGNTGGAIVHARCTQDFGGLEHVYIYGGNRTCAWFEHGDGGASSVFLDRLSCSTSSTGPQVKIGNTFGSGLAYGTTVIEINDLVLGGPSAGSSFQTGNGLLLQGGGQVSVKGGHAEAMPAGIEIDFPSGTGNTDMVSIERFNAGSGAPAPTCGSVIQIDATSQAGQFINLKQIPAGSCTHIVADGRSGFTNIDTRILGEVQK
jgi:hypothetical protein